jgi:hypothetical protein
VTWCNRLLGLTLGVLIMIAGAAASPAFRVSARPGVPGHYHASSVALAATRPVFSDLERLASAGVPGGASSRRLPHLLAQSDSEGSGSATGSPVRAASWSKPRRHRSRVRSARCSGDSLDPGRPARTRRPRQPDVRQGELILLGELTTPRPAAIARFCMDCGLVPSVVGAGQPLITS